jgi:TonB family protein
LIRPRVQSIAPPSFTVAPDVAPPAPSSAEAPNSPLLASATAGTGAADQTGPASGGSGTSMAGQMASADGTNGNGAVRSGCWDAAWAESVRDRIGHFFYYPPRARQQHVEGVVIVHMVIRRSGLLNLLEVNKSSGNTLLDQAATHMVRNAEPLPRIPARMHAERVDAEMPIEFGNSGQKFKATENSCG